MTTNRELYHLDRLPNFEINELNEIEEDLKNNKDTNIFIGILEVQSFEAFAELSRIISNYIDMREGLDEYFDIIDIQVFNVLDDVKKDVQENIKY